MSHKVATQWDRAESRLLLAVAMDPKEIGRRIKQARDVKLWTQIQFAAEANVSPSSVARWEGGQLPPVRELVRIADVLGVEPEWLVEVPSLNGDDDLAVTIREALSEVLAGRPAPEGAAPGDAWYALVRQLQDVGDQIGEAATRFEAAANRLGDQPQAKDG